MSQRNRHQSTIALPGQPDLAATAAAMQAQQQSNQELAEYLYGQALAGCVAADFARGMAREDERQRREPGSPVKPIELQAQLVAGAATQYARMAFQALRGPGPQSQQQEQQAKAG